MSTDKHPTLYVIAHGGRWVMASCASTTRSFVEADLRRLLSKEPAFPGNPEVVPYVPASVLDALRAENERLRTTIDGATVIGATTAKTCGRGEPSCKRVPGHAGDCMGLFGEALAADLSDARAENERLTARNRTLETAVGVVASAIRVKHAYYEDARNDPKPARTISADEAGWRRMLESAERGDADAVTARAEAEIETLREQVASLRAEVEALRRERFCDACGGAGGANLGNGTHRCETCNGTGDRIAALTARAEKAEAERDGWRGEVARIARLVGMPEGEGPEIGAVETWMLAARREAAEWKAKAEAAVAHAAALEAAVVFADGGETYCDLCAKWTDDATQDWHADDCPMRGGTSALAAHDAARDAEVRKRVEALPSRKVMALGASASIDQVVLLRADVLATIRAKGG